MSDLLICYLHIDTKMNEITFTGTLVSKSIVISASYIPRMIFREQYIDTFCKNVCLELKTQFKFNDHLLITDSNNKIIRCIKNKLELHLNSCYEKCNQNKSKNESLLIINGVLIILILSVVIKIVSNKLLF